MPRKYYYKATRPDGTDFATGTTDVVGALKTKQWMPPIKGPLEMCRYGYHVSDAMGETLIGGTWPCRLFRVELKAVRRQKEGHKYVVRTYRPVAELPAWKALGPHGQLIVRLIEAIAGLSPADRRKVDAACDAAGAAARAAACDAARAAAGAAAGAATAWDAACDAAGAAARDAACDAAGALVVKDKISRKHYLTLAGPMATVMPWLLEEAPHD